MFRLGSNELIVGLGTSSPDGIGALRRAKSALRAHPMFVLKSCSAIYESDALLPEGAPESWRLRYLNAAVKLELRDQAASSSRRSVAAREIDKAAQAYGDGADPGAHARTVLNVLKSIEAKLGRVPSERWAPREIDLDILDWGRGPLNSPEIKIPHTGLTERPFALLPAWDCVPLETADARYWSWRNSPADDVPLCTRRSREVWSELMGILNLTPDSFSGGSLGRSLDQVRGVIERLVQGGATWLDVGAESTRPGAQLISEAEELARLKPYLGLLAELKSTLGFKLSLDTRHLGSAMAVHEAIGLDCFNNVADWFGPSQVGSSQLRTWFDHFRGAHVVMHSRGVPPVKDQVLDLGRDPVDSLIEESRPKIDAFRAHRATKDPIFFDPGIGFGKTAAQNALILEGAEKLHSLGVPLLIGHSRKRFLDPYGEVPADARDWESAFFTSKLEKAGIDIIRVHETELQGRALRLGNAYA